MTRRIGGFRRKTRSKLKKAPKKRGKVSLQRYFQIFQAGDRVRLQAEPAVQKGMYFPRFHAKDGVIRGKQGRCYAVAIKDGQKKKVVLVHPVHLRRVA